MSTATLSTYAEMTARNLEHMGTPAQDWHPIPVSGFHETQNAKGETVSMPVFNFPSGYAPAPTLYNQADECGLCSHPIRNVFWIQNDKERWTLPVGCECVTHFADGMNGVQAARKDIAEANRNLITRCRKIRQSLWEIHLKTHERRPRILSTGFALKNCALGNWSKPHQWIPEFPDPEFYPDGVPHWGDRKISNWLKKHRPALETLLAEVTAEFPEAIQLC